MRGPPGTGCHCNPASCFKIRISSSSNASSTVLLEKTVAHVCLLSSSILGWSDFFLAAVFLHATLLSSCHIVLNSSVCTCCHPYLTWLCRVAVPLVCGGAVTCCCCGTQYTATMRGGIYCWCIQACFLPAAAQPSNHCFESSKRTCLYAIPVHAPEALGPQRA